MLRLKHCDITPPRSKWGRGWHYIAPDGTLIVGGDIGDLLKHVMAYRVANGLPFDTITDDVHDWLCRNTAAKCAPPKPAVAGEPRPINRADIWRFLTAMIAWIRNGTLVEQDEAERRAEICAGCRMQVDLSGCWGCAGLFGMIGMIIGNRKTKMDHALKNCQVCGCVNSVAVWVPLEVLRKAHGDLEYPEDTTGTEPKIPCWRRE